MKRFISWLKKFFFPPAGTSRWLRVLPYAILGLLTLVVLLASAYAWEYTNSPEFCGTACHTMPPEYTAYLTSPHARVDCVDCHIGEGFITTRITRKAGDAKHIIRLMFRDYEFPITAEEMRPARETCELCHFPEKFSDDSLREIKSYHQDQENTPTTTYLVMKTGGGSKRLGLGQGIHWHIENPVYFYAPDHDEQYIPYVQVVNEDGSTTGYVDIESDFDPDQIAQEDLEEMDCITCHNRITHLVNQPEDILDQLMERGIVSPDIPEIKRVAVEIFYREFETTNAALMAIGAIDKFYQTYYPVFFAQNETLVATAVTALQNAYTQSVYPEQKSDWDSHPNNIGHQFSPGCFRCHDGKHLNQQEEAIRLECNVCHSIPVVAEQFDFVADIEISLGPEPESHLNPNWITLHRDVFDQTCQSCHTTEDPGGTSNTSFCSNSACHGNVYEYAGFNAPALREILRDQLPEIQAEPESEVEQAEQADQPVEAPPEQAALTYDGAIAPMLVERCSACHGDTAMSGLNLTSYTDALEGGESGPAIIPGEPENSLLIQIQSGDQPHFGQFTADELDVIEQWISAGAPEN